MPAQQTYATPTGAPWNAAQILQTARDISTSWLTTDEIANQLNLFGDESQDAYLESLELAARMAIEDYLGLPIFNNTFVAYYAVGTLMATPLTLGLPQVSQSGTTINSVKAYNNATPPALVTLATSSYYYDVTGQQVILLSVPNNISTQMAAPLQVTWTNTASIMAQYPVVKQAGLLMVAHLYNQRSDTSERKLNCIPFGVEALLRPYKPLVM